MFSAEEECVDLEPTLYPKGNVEDWLLLVEQSMRNTRMLYNKSHLKVLSHFFLGFLVRVTLGRSLDDIMDKPRTEWVLEWPGQLVIAGSQTFWTTGVENGIAEGRLDFFLEGVMLMNVSR